MLFQLDEYPQIDALEFDVGDAPSTPFLDPAGSIEFLQRHCPENGIAVVTAIVPDCGKILTKSAEYDNIESTLGPFIKRHVGKRNLYFSVNQVKKLLTKKASKANIASLDWLHVDVDPVAGKDLSAERKRIKEQIDAFSPKPNVIIDSGGGYQAFWRLHEPLPIVNGNYAERERFNIALRDHFGGGDSCHNIDRIMRLPGTYNLPTETKRKKGRTTAPAVLVHMDAGAYEPEEVIESAGAAPATPGGIPLISVKTLNVSERIKTLIRKGHDDKRYESRSEAIFAVIMALVKAGESDGTITAVCLNPDNGISAKMLEMESAAAIKYMLGDIKRAREKVGELFDRYVYTARIDRFIEVANLAELTATQLDRQNAVQYPLGQRTPTASTIFLNSALGRRVDRPTYLPGGDLIFKEDGDTVLNMARPFNLNPTAGDVKRWLDLVELVIPDAEAREIVLDWMAYQIQHPTEKPNWAVFIGGEQGIGKDFIFIPLLEILTDYNHKIITPDDLKNGWTSWLQHAKLAVVEEMADFGKKEIANLLKPLITTPPYKLRINGKYVPQYDIPNRASFVFFSNKKDALSLEKGDRRFFIYWSPAKPRSESYYIEIKAWMDTNVGMVAHHLLQRDLSGFNAKGRAPMTTAKQNMIEASRSVLEQHLAAQFEDGEPPLDKDLVNVTEIIEQLPQHLQGKASRNKVADTLETLGGQQLGKQAILPGGKKVRLWAMRRAEMYSTLTQHQLGKAYTKGARGSLAKFAAVKK